MSRKPCQVIIFILLCRSSASTDKHDATSQPPTSQPETCQVLTVMKALSMKLDRLLEKMGSISVMQSSITEMKTLVKKSTLINARTIKHTKQDIQYVINNIRYIHQDLSIKLDKEIAVASRALEDRELLKLCRTPTETERTCP
uniref:PDZ domain-containing protein 2 n=1 Tax=Lygus hesperus TaxID=30085 RepID=A0A0A9YI29_LYGHE